MDSRRKSSLNRQRCVAVIAIFLQIELTGCAREESQWAAIQADPTSAELSEFLEKYPDGSFGDEAAALLVEVEEWAFARNENSLDSLQNYIATFPDGAFTADADEALRLAVQDLVQTFEPEYVMILVGEQLVARDGHYVAEWYGPLVYALGTEGMFTGIPLYQPPDPSQRSVAVAVLDDTGLIGTLIAGHAYVWRGGNDLIEWKEFQVLKDNVDWRERQALADQFGLPPSAEYANIPDEFLAVQR